VRDRGVDPAGRARRWKVAACALAASWFRRMLAGPAAEIRADANVIEAYLGA
jgi:hypothetical protein